MTNEMFLGFVIPSLKNKFSKNIGDIKYGGVYDMLLHTLFEIVYTLCEAVYTFFTLHIVCIYMHQLCTPLGLDRYVIKV